MGTRKKESWIDNVHGCGILEHTRELFLIGDVETEQLDILVKNLRILESSNKNLITIYFSTFGGSVCSAFGMYDHIQNCESPVRIVVSGPLMSAGTLILQAGDERYCMPNACFMLHDGYTGISEHIHKSMLLTAKWEETLLVKFRDIIAERIASTKKSNIDKVKRTLKSKMQYEWYLTADEALELGIVDKVLY